jgi:trans-aconitate methyltransferase
VTGLDISPEQIALARKHCPGGSYSVADIAALQRGAYTVQAVVCLYALFHIPRTHHQRMLSVMASYLPKGGMLLITMGDRAFEGEHQLLGATLWSSQYGTAENSALIRRAGFKIHLDEVDTSGGERHQVILAEKV